MYLYFPYLGTWIFGDCTVRYSFFFSPPIPERASNRAIVEKPGCTHSYYEAQSADPISKTMHSKQGATALPHPSWALQEYKHYFTVQTYVFTEQHKPSVDGLVSFNLVELWYKKSHLLNT